MTPATVVDWDKTMFTTLREIRQLKVFPISDFMSPNDHPIVLTAMEEVPPNADKPAKAVPGAEKPEKPPKVTSAARGSGSSERLGWDVKHLHAFREVELTWPPEYDSAPELRDAMTHLPERSRQIVWFMHHVYKTEGLTHEVLVDFHQSMDFGSKAKFARPCPCIIGTTRLFSLSRCRELCGRSLGSNLIASVARVLILTFVTQMTSDLPEVAAVLLHRR